MLMSITCGWLIKEESTRVCDQANANADSAPLASRDARDGPISIVSDHCILNPPKTLQPDRDSAATEFATAIFELLIWL